MTCGTPCRRAEAAAGLTSWRSGVGYDRTPIYATRRQTALAQDGAATFPEAVRVEATRAIIGNQSQTQTKLLADAGAGATARRGARRSE
jgi:hypothetical protein